MAQQFPDSNRDGRGVLKFLFVLMFGLFAREIDAQIEAQFVGTDASCFEAFDGEACCFNITGGVPPYTCAINSEYGTPNGTCFEDLPPGPYTIVITDSQGTVGDGVVMVGFSDYPEIIADVAVIPATCGGANGSISATIGGGSGNYVYIWFQENPLVQLATGSVSEGQTITLSGQPEGEYTLFLNDSETICNHSYSLYITESILELGATLTHSDCVNNCNGAIDLTPTGTAPYTYTWSNGATTEDLTSLCAGNYTVNVTDANGCTGTATYTITLNGADVIVGGVGNADNTITTNILWNPDYFGGQTQIIVDADVIVSAGATLTIVDLDVRFTPTHALRAEGSSHIIGDNSIFDVICGPTWRGFEIKGTGVATPFAQRSTLNLANNCEVRHAECGVRNYQPGPPPSFGSSSTTSGGLITCTNTTFIDNVQDIKLLNFYQNGTGSGNPCAAFTSCEFRLTAAGIPAPHEGNLGNPEANWPRIHLQRVVDVTFFDCFLNNQNLFYGNNVRIRGVASDYSDFVWSGTTPTNPMDETTYSSRVYGFRMGFWVQGGSLTNNENNNIGIQTKIENTYFQSWDCVYVSAGRVVRVFDNYFHPLDFNAGYINTNIPADVAGPMFIYLTHTTYNGVTAMDYQVSGNVFDSNDPAKKFTGILAYRTGAFDNFIYSNRFEGCNKAIDFNAQNRDNSANTDAGSHVECNDFINNIEDIHIRNTGGAAAALYGIAPWQGHFAPPFQNNQESAGNQFNPSDNATDYDDIEFLSATTNNHNYRYTITELNDNVAPFNGTPTEVDPSMTLVVTDFPHQCNWIYNIAGDGNNQNMMLQESKANYEALQEGYALLEDGGNTWGLTQEVLESTFYDALQLYATLTNQSPALSDEVIIATISNETALPNSLLAAVIAMNPAAAKSAAVHEAIEGKTNPLTNYQKTLIEAARQNISPKELIKEQMAHAYCQMQRAKAELIATASTTADAIGYLEDTKFMQDRWIKADLLYASGDIAAPNSLLLSSGAYFNLSTDAQAELVAYSDYKTTEQAILSRENSTLKPAEETYLRSLYENDVYGLGILAINLLNAFGGHDLMLAIPDAPPGNYHSLTYTDEARIPVVSVYPNPAQNFVVINTTELVPATIKLMQWDGKEVLNAATEGVRDQIVLNLQDIEQGVYVLLLYSEAGELLYQTNIIKK
jgi:hypothetical protein